MELARCLRINVFYLLSCLVAYSGCTCNRICRNGARDGTTGYCADGLCREYTGEDGKVSKSEMYDIVQNHLDDFSFFLGHIKKLLE